MRYVFGEWTLDTQRAELYCSGCVCRLRRKAFQVLAYLLAHPDRVVSKQELCEQVWSQQCLSETALESTIKVVRQALGDSGRGQQLIQTVYGQDYRFLAAVGTGLDTPVSTSSEGQIAPRSAQSTSAQTAHDLVPTLSPQEPVCIGEGSLDTDASSKEESQHHDVQASPGEWKLVTVLCCTLVVPAPGTSLALETYYRQLRALYILVREVVLRYEGTLQPLVGEHILALFGAPLAQEAHAQRAMLAALELQQRVGEAGNACNAPLGSRLEIRLGLHTGQVAVGLFEATPEGAGAVVGEALTQAGVLQAQAAPGTIRCSWATARLVHEVAQVVGLNLAKLQNPAR